MNALLINPTNNQIALIIYDPVRSDDFTEVIKGLIGGDYTYETVFPNGDGLFTLQGSAFDKNNIAVRYNTLDDVYFGKTLIVRLTRDFRLVPCRHTLQDLRNQARICSREETEQIRMQKT